MEYLEGAPITSHCDQRQLSVQDRLGLFQQVCAAVGYAHSRGVLHRDIKPSNILITDEGVPKLLDFGLAVLSHPEVTSTQERVSAQFRFLTPEYSSPEVLQQKPVTEASDLFSLGAVLYELLTGSLPCWATLEEPSANRPARRRLVPPSEVLLCTQDNRAREAGPSLDTLEEIGAARRTTVRGLRREFAKDLDWIVEKCLELEPHERYVSVRPLDEDITQTDRFL